MKTRKQTHAEQPQDIILKNYRELRDRVARTEELHALMPETVCPVCYSSFRTVQGRNSHLSSAKLCSQYRKGEFKASFTEDKRLLSLLGPQISRTGSRIPNLGNQGTEKTSTSAGHLEEDPLGDLGNQETEKTSISAGHLEEDPLGEVGAHHWEDIIEVAPVVSWTHRQLRLQKEKEE